MICTRNCDDIAEMEGMCPDCGHLGLLHPSNVQEFPSRCCPICVLKELQEVMA